MRSGPVRTLFALFGCLGTLVREAHADTEAVRTVYRAPAECPSEDGFWRELTARTDLARHATDGNFDRTFEVIVTKESDGYAGRLEIVEPDGERALRSLDDQDCSELVRALSFIASIAVNEKAREKAAVLALKQSASESLRRSGSRPPPALPERRWVPGAAAQTTLLGAVAPKALFTGGVRFELAAHFASPWSPTFALALLAGQTGTLSPTVELAQFRWLGGRLELCPLKLTFGAMLSLRPCALADLAALRATGDSAPHPGEATRFWAATGALAALRWSPEGGFFVDAQAGALVPLTRDDFIFENPKILVHRPAAVGVTAALALGFSFQ